MRPHADHRAAGSRGGRDRGLSRRGGAAARGALGALIADAERASSTAQESLTAAAGGVALVAAEPAPAAPPVAAAVLASANAAALAAPPAALAESPAALAESIVAESPAAVTASALAESPAALAESSAAITPFPVAAPAAATVRVIPRSSPAASSAAPPVTLPTTDAALIRRCLGVLGPIFDRYFRAEVRHLERVPAEPSLLVAHHDGGVLPLDGIALGVAWHRTHGGARPLRVFMHDIPFQLGAPLRRLLHGIGALPASPRYLEAALDGGDTGLLYPGAAREAFRPFADRRKIDLGGRSGFIARALRRGVPITPVVSAGVHEALVILSRGERIADWLGITRRFRADAWPLALGLPWGVFFGPFWPYLPLPTKITVEVLPPIHLETALGRRVGPRDADDPATVAALFEHVRATMQRAVERLYAERRWPVLG